jgi:PAS domain S-box-containing protein
MLTVSHNRAPGKPATDSPKTELESTKRKLRAAERELAESRVEFGHVLDLVTQGLRIIDRDRTVRAVNKAFAQMSGIGVADAIGRKCNEIFPSPFCNTPQCRLTRILQGEEVVTAEIERPRNGGGTIPCVITAIPFRNDAGETIGVIETLRDLTLRRKMQAQLAESESRYKALIDLGTEVGEAVVMLQDINGTEALQTFVSDEWSRITGYSKDELLKMSFFDLMSPQDRKASQQRHRLKMSGKALRGLYELNIRRKNGSLVPVELTSAFTMSGGERANVAYIRDISDRKKSDEELNKRATLLKAQLDASIDGIMIVDPKGNRLLQNSSVNRIWGINPELDDSENRLALIAARTKSPDLFRKNVMKLAGDPVVTVRDEVELVDGKIIERYSAPVVGANGERYGRIWNFHDVTESKLAEQAVKDSEELYRALFENTGTATSLSEDDLTITLVNTEFEKLSGYSKAEIEGKKKWTEFVPQAEMQGALEYSRQIGESPSSIPASFEMSFIDCDKHVKNVIITVNRIPGSDRRIASIKDITRRKKAEKDLKKSRQRIRDLLDHVEMVREEERKHMAQEMHDELGQLLTALKMDVVWLAKHVPGDQENLQSKTHQMRQTVEMTIQSIKRISAELRPHLLDNLGLSAAIEWQLKQIQEVTGIECSLTSRPSDVVTDSPTSIALFRIFQEAVTNAVRHARASRISVLLEQLPDRVRLSVSDNGLGIKHSEIIDAKSFGLISIKERAHAIGGNVEISGKTRKGTTITAEIPVKNREERNGKNPHR